MCLILSAMTSQLKTKYNIIITKGGNGRPL